MARVCGRVAEHGVDHVVARKLDITTFLNSPPRISQAEPGDVDVARVAPHVELGDQLVGRTIGPATRCGKNDR